MRTEETTSMYNLLVVDDEEIAVRGIVEGVNWSDLPLGEILSACDVEEAMQLFQVHDIHILLSDIDMPDHNGIELLKWVREHSPETETIFLSGHSDFGYVSQALQLDSFDYLLKPIDHQHIKDTLCKVIEKIQQDELHKQFHRTYEYYYQQWNKQLPILAERFWQDVLNLRNSLDPAYLTQLYSLYNIPLQPEDHVQLMLISVEDWNESLSTRDEEIMTYAIMNAGDEIILKHLDGQLIREAGGVLYAIIYAVSPDTHATLHTSCLEYINKCRTYLHCELSCYISEPIEVSELHSTMHRLTALERHYLSKGGTVIWLGEYKEPTASVEYEPQLQNLGLLLEAGKREEMIKRIESNLLRMEQSYVDPLILEGYYHGLVHTVYDVLMKKSISIKDVYPNEDWRIQSSVFKSLQRFRDWAIPFALQTVDYISQHHRMLSPFIHKAISYIEEHLSEELNREDIASHVYLNPAYLSRLFKKETGQSLTDYILETRIDRVRPLLVSTNQKISDLAISVGFFNFSHFTKSFKKLTGLTPNEYRRTYQQVE